MQIKIKMWSQVTKKIQQITRNLKSQIEKTNKTRNKAHFPSPHLKFTLSALCKLKTSKIKKWVKAKELLSGFGGNVGVLE